MLFPPLISSALAPTPDTFDWLIFGFGVVLLFVFAPLVAFVRFKYRTDPAYSRWRALTWFWYAFAIYNFINGLYRIRRAVGFPEWTSGILVGLGVVSMIAGIVLTIREWRRIRS